MALAVGSVVTTTTTATAAVSPEPPAVIETGPNEYQHFFVDNGKVIQRAKSATGAYRDTVVAASTGFASLPVAVVLGAGRVSLAAVKGGRVYFTSKESVTGAWKPFQDLGGTMSSGITMVSYNYNDAVGIYGVSGGQLLYRGQVAFGGGFSPWENLGGSELSGRPTPSHRREIVRGAQLTVRQGAGAAVYQHYADNPANNRFIDRSGPIKGTHLVSARDPRRGTRLFGTNPDGQVVTNGFGDLVWASLNSPKTALPPAAAFDEVREGSDVVIRAADGYVYRSRQVGSTDEFSPWVRVGESRYGSGATIVKLLNDGDAIFFTDQLGATHVCGLDALGNDTGCRVLR
ncbi:hypothetical protein UK23_09765 [Lentzea aerocolonigenes]|uniref:Uncharacterized protein n=1 Tax=Lentzea aerocolonigenes TaxID=68170 RepID=A0A0F0H588_LENAE|nr:hypothetical protein UK23_09765 [Lentzea aerocolonigenes]